MDTVTEILLGIALLPFFLLDALAVAEKNIAEDLSKARSERVYGKKKLKKQQEHEKKTNEN